MAVLDSCPGIEVSIILNNKVLKEYRDLNADDSQNSTTSYIEVEAAAAFEVDLEVTDTYTSRHGLRVEVRLDGKKIEDTLIRVEDLHKSGGHRFSGVTSKINGWWFTSDPSFVKFMSDTTSQWKRIGEVEKHFRSVGTISVLVWRVKASHRRGHRSRRTAEPGTGEPQDILGADQVPEAVVEDAGLQSNRSVDKTKPSKSVRTKRTVHVDGPEDKDAQAIFHFKYRSQEMLKENRVVPKILRSVGRRAETPDNGSIIGYPTPTISGTYDITKVEPGYCDA